MPASPRNACGGRPWVSSFCTAGGRRVERLAPAEEALHQVAGLQRSDRWRRSPRRPRRPASPRRAGTAARSSARRSCGRACRGRPSSRCCLTCTSPGAGSADLDARELEVVAGGHPDRPDFKRTSREVIDMAWLLGLALRWLAARHRASGRARHAAVDKRAPRGQSFGRFGREDPNGSRSGVAGGRRGRRRFRRLPRRPVRARWRTSRWRASTTRMRREPKRWRPNTPRARSSGWISCGSWSM